MEPNRTSETAETASAKKEYRAPRLVEYGSVAKLTQNAGATVEQGTGMQCL